MCNNQVTFGFCDFLALLCNIVVLGQLWHKLNYFQLGQNFKKKKPFLSKFSKTHSNRKPILNQGPT
jgi:hypothetical protein